MRGRAPGRGRLTKTDKGYVGEWRDSQGVRHRRVLSTDKRAAERILASEVRSRDLERAGLGGEEADARVSALADLYVSALEGQRRPAYIHKVSASLARVIPAFPLSVREIRASHVQAFLESRTAKGAANRTANMDLAVLRAALNWAVRTELLGKNPIAAVHLLPSGPRDLRKHRRALSEDEAKRLLATAAEADRMALAGMNRAPTAYPQEPMWRFLLETGARFGETTALRWRDMSIQGACVTFRAETTKTSKARTLPLSQATVSRLRRLQELGTPPGARGPDPDAFVFLSPMGRRNEQSNCYSRLMGLLERAGIPRKSPAGTVDIHALRHTAATRMARAGVGMAHAQFVLGHSDPRITMAVYTRLVADDVRAAVNKLPAL